MKSLFALLMFFAPTAWSQDSIRVDTAKLQPLAISAYVETYYAFDFNRPGDHNRPLFFYNHNRHNEFNVNLAFIKASYTGSQVRGNIALAAGTYMNANYSAEPGVLKNVLEANAGFKLGKKSDLWLDAGIFPSHIGFESATGKDNHTVTRSLLAENSPYFETGAKLSFSTRNNKWLFSAMALNGWQRITTLNGNSLMSFGTQVTYKPSTGVTFNHSSFIGTDTPDSARQLRYFSNFFGLMKLSRKLELTVGLDVGAQESSNFDKALKMWWSGVLLGKYGISNRWSVTGRVEYYSDKDEIIVSPPLGNKFKTFGASLNADYSPAANLLFRVEIRSLYSKTPIFEKAGRAVQSNSFATAVVAISF